MTAVQAIKKYLWIFVKYFSIIFFSFIAILPIVSCVITAFKTDAEYQSTNVMTPPESWLNFQNFIDAICQFNNRCCHCCCRFCHDRFHAGICTEPFHIPWKRTDS